MLTLGIDLAAQPSKTAACFIEWAAGIGRVHWPNAGPLTDDHLVELATRPGVAKVAIDSPFGWPRAFSNAVASHAVSNSWPAEWRDGDQFVLRATDVVVREEVQVRPLSVSASLLAVVAMRCAGLLARLEKAQPVDRSGVGLTVEVYPAAALRRWQCSPAVWLDDPGSYKGMAADRVLRRSKLVDELQQRLDGTVALSAADLSRIKATDDDLDAFVSALVARAAAIGATSHPSAEHEAAARIEGWIALPTCALDQLDQIPGN